MLCCSCKKNQATNIHEKITDGRKQTEYYCADCYRRLFLSATQKSDVCPVCGRTAKEFSSTGLVGCGACYKYLVNVVAPVVLRMQGADKHVGKTPKREEKV